MHDLFVQALSAVLFRNHLRTNIAIFLALLYAKVLDLLPGLAIGRDLRKMLEVDHE